MRALTRWPPWLPRGWTADVSLALILIVCQVFGTIATPEQDMDYQPLDWLGYLLLVAGPLAVAGRRRWPMAVLAVNIVATGIYMTRQYPVGAGTALLAMFVAVYLAASTGSRLRSFVTFVASAGGFIGSVAVTNPDVEIAAFGVYAAMVLGAVAIGEAVQAHRALRVEAEERAAQAERTREAEARRRVGEERVRIARELHDVLSHSVSMMNVQAGVAAHLLDEQPEQARSALLAIKGASKDVLRELRATLGTLRRVDEADDETSRAPTPGVALLDELVARTVGAGLPVDLRTDGEPRKLPDAVDLAAYRIVQEALTNVTRHAGPATAAVLVTYGEHDLFVQVVDDGHGAGAAHIRHAAQAGGGNGIVGMRERAHALGGEVEVGPRNEGGFRVRARLPMGDGNMGGGPDGQAGGKNTGGGPEGQGGGKNTDGAS